MATPTVKLNVDWQADPAAGYFDTMRSRFGIASVWRMDDTSGTVLVDYLGLNSGTRVGGPTSVSGPYAFETSNSLRYGGVNDYSWVPYSASLQGLGSWELAGWLKVTTVPATTKGIATKGAVTIDLLSSGKIRARVVNHVAGVSTTTTLTSNTVLTAGSWYYISVVLDWDAGIFYLFVNGRAEVTAVHTVGTETHALPLLFAGKHGGTVPTPVNAGAQGAFNNTTSLVIPAPASIVAGNLLLAHVNRNVGVTMTPPAGWSLLYQTPWAVNSRFSAIYWKIAAAGDVGAANYTFTLSGNSFGAGIISQFSGIDSSQPFANPPYENHQESTGPFSTLTTASRFPLVDDALVLGIFSTDSAGSITSSDTELYDQPAAGGGAGFAEAMYTSGVATAAGKTITATPIAAVASYSAIWIALKGPDAQDFANVDMKDWSWRTSAPSEDDVEEQWQSRLGGVGTLTDIAADLIAVETSSGRQYELNKIESGSMSETLNNKSRKYDPVNKNSIYSPNVIPKRRVALVLNISATDYPVAEGYFEEFPSRYLSPNYDEMKLPAVDGFTALAQQSIVGTINPGLSGPQINKILDLAKFPLSKRAIDVGAYTMVGETFTDEQDQKAKPLVQSIAESEFGIFFYDRDGKATFHDRNHRWSAARSLSSQATFEDVEGANIFYEDLVHDFGDSYLVNKWTVSPHSTVLGGVAQTVRDVVSEHRFWPVADKLETRLDANVSALEIATALLNRTAEPILRFKSMKVKPYSTAVWVTCLGLRISDRVTVIRKPIIGAGGTNIQMDCFIEGIAWSLEAGGEWSVTYQLSPVSPQQWYRMSMRSKPRAYYRMNGT